MKNLLICFSCVLLLYSCNNAAKMDYQFHEGPIQGTMFHITYEWDKDLSTEIDSLLEVFNKSLSNYDSESVISKINNNQTSKTDALVQEMIESSLLVYNNTDGAFDITIAPIVNAWGFGWDKNAESEMPTVECIDSLLGYVGMDRITITDGELIKDMPQTMFVTNAIAQGFSVDFVADYFFDLGLKNFLIEIGGEIYCYGENRQREDWRIGIDKPIEGTGYGDRENQIIVNLSGRAIATSGNYRKFIENNGNKIGHSIDPRTGYFAENSLLSVSVVSTSCMMCDAYATAFMVSGLDKSMSIVETLENTEAYFIYQNDNSEIKFKYSSGFKSLVVE